MEWGWGRLGLAAETVAQPAVSESHVAVLPLCIPLQLCPISVPSLKQSYYAYFGIFL